jgi:hypothetical protein
MKTIEELKEMTQEELIALVQELEEKNKKQSDSNTYWYNKSTKYQSRYESLKSVLKGVVTMIE